MAELDWAAVREAGLKNFELTDLPPTLKLPALPHAVTLFVEKSNREDATTSELAAVLETDTGLTMELLRHVNSAYHGLRQKARNVQQALMLLGLRRSKMFVVTTGMQAAVQSRKSKLINQGCFWNASLQKALFAREVACLLHADPETAFAGGLLQDYLLPVVTNDLFGQYLRFVQDRDRLPNSLCEYEQSTFRWDHAIAAASLAHRWNLPDDLVCCLLYHHHGLRVLAQPELKRTAVAAVALSAMLPDQLRQDRGGLELLRRLGTKWPAFDLLQLAERVDALHEEMSLGLHNDFPLSRRCQPAGSIGGDNYNDGTLKSTAISA